MTETKLYFDKVILMMLLSVLIFLGFKAILPDHLFPKQEVTANDNIIVDDMMKAAIEAEKGGTDSTDVDVDPIAAKDLVVGTDSVKTRTPVAVEAENAATDPTLSGGGYRHLSRFYAKLRKLETTKTGKLRIAYFGDSMTDGDLIVQDIRQDMQHIYGGQGVGFVAIASLSAGGRYSVSHQYSKNWKTQSFLDTKKKPLSPYGISGQVFLGNDTTQTYWVKYKAQGIKYSTALNKPTLFYGKADNSIGKVTIKADDTEAVTKELSPAKTLNTIRLSDDNPKSLKLDFQRIDSIPVYGVNFDNGSGVHIDNFSLRGNSGLPLSILNNELMHAFDKALGYDLIILQYGANVLNDDIEGYGWYTRGMQKVVENLKNCFPNADILIISTADKASKVETEMKTPPVVGMLLRSQKNCARNTDSGFINLFNLMGGDCSMVEWVDNNLAGKDYTHFNAQGAKKIARLIYGELAKGYNLHKKNNPEETAGEEDKIDKPEEQATTDADTVVSVK